MKIKLFGFFVVIILLQGCEVVEDKIEVKSFGNNISITPCWFDKDDGWPEIKCGVLTVPEDYSQIAGRKVKLPFLIIKATESKIDSVPVVVAGGGGPGNGLRISKDDSYSIDRYNWVDLATSSYESGRDLILIDNRGVGSSIPKLECKKMRAAELTSLNTRFSKLEQIARTKKAYKNCKQNYEDQGIDLSQYNVTNAANDLEELRKGLVYNQLNVYGISYGTRVALEYERRYPNSVRAMILDSVYPQSIKAYERTAYDSSAAISRMINKCNEDEACANKFGNNLSVQITNFLQKLDKEPLTITLMNPVNYQPMDVLVTPDVFFDTLYSLLYRDSGFSKLPKILHSVFNGNTDLLTEYVRDYYVNDIVIHSIDEAAYASYSCYDEIPFNDFKKAKAAISKYPFQKYSTSPMLDYAKAMCEVWNVPAAQEDFKKSYTIDTPLLIYSGLLDPATPPSMTKPVVRNARTLWKATWPNIAHDVMSVSSCADWVGGQFLDKPNEEPFVFDCSDDKVRFRFDLN